MPWTVWRGASEEAGWRRTERVAEARLRFLGENLTSDSGA
jgi:hypothetical protein